MDVNRKAKELLNTIRQTTEYKEAIKWKNHIENSPNLRQQVKLFLDKQQEIYMQQLSPKETEKQLRLLQQNFDELTKSNEVKHYINSMQQLQKLISTTYQFIFEEIDDDLYIE